MKLSSLYSERRKRKKKPKVSELKLGDTDFVYQMSNVMPDRGPSLNNVDPRLPSGHLLPSRGFDSF